MARKTRLKVFRTPIGFHDAYVAAPSQKAALKAWGSDSNLFASGAAERVEDPELMGEPLAHPGTVIRRLRGTMAEHMAALPKDQPRSRRRTKESPADDPSPRARNRKPKSAPKPPLRSKPRPDRAPLERAEAKLADVEKRHDEERTVLAKRQDELDRERRKLEARQARERETLERKADAARDKYDRAIRAWRAD